MRRDETAFRRSFFASGSEAVDAIAACGGAVLGRESMPARRAKSRPRGRAAAFAGSCGCGLCPAVVAAAGWDSHSQPSATEVHAMRPSGVVGVVCEPELCRGPGPGCERERSSLPSLPFVRSTRNHSCALQPATRLDTLKNDPGSPLAAALVRAEHARDLALFVSPSSRCTTGSRSAPAPPRSFKPHQRRQSSVGIGDPWY